MSHRGFGAGPQSPPRPRARCYPADHRQRRRCTRVGSKLPPSSDPPRPRPRLAGAAPKRGSCHVPASALFVRAERAWMHSSSRARWKTSAASASVRRSSCSAASSARPIRFATSARQNGVRPSSARRRRNRPRSHAARSTSEPAKISPRLAAWSREAACSKLSHS